MNFDKKNSFIKWIETNVGNENLVNLLIRSNADVHAKDRLDLSPLHYAVRAGERNRSLL